MLTTLLNNKYLVRELVARDIRSRYVGSVVGVFWSILNPLIQLGLYTVIFSVILKGKIGDDGSTGRFAESLFCALLPWMALQEGVTRSSRTFIENSPLIKKVRFQAKQQHGFITGETLVDVEDPCHVIVISTWQTQDDWKAWDTSALRAETKPQIEELLVEPFSAIILPLPVVWREDMGNVF